MKFHCSDGSNSLVRVTQKSPFLNHADRSVQFKERIPFRGKFHLLINNATEPQFPQLCGTGDAALQADLRQDDESTCPGAAEKGGVVQCVRTEQDDQSRHAGVSKNLKETENTGRFCPASNYSTTPVFI